LPKPAILPSLVTNGRELLRWRAAGAPDGHSVGVAAAALGSSIEDGARHRTASRQRVGIRLSSYVPVYVLPAAAADAGQDTVERIVHQVVTNDQKHDLTDVRRARGIQQMINAGVDVAQPDRLDAATNPQEINWL
jgi:hypothetical protein